GSDCLDVNGLPIGARSDGNTEVAYFDLGSGLAVLFSRYVADDLRHVGRGYRILLQHGGFELLEDRGGLQHCLFLAAQMDLALAGCNPSRDRFANLPQMLIRSTQELNQLIRISYRDRRFNHLLLAAIKYPLRPGVLEK